MHADAAAVEVAVAAEVVGRVVHAATAVPAVEVDR